MNSNEYKLGVRLNQLDVEESMNYKKAERWDNIGIMVGCIGFAVVLYSFLF